MYVPSHSAWRRRLRPLRRSWSMLFALVALAPAGVKATTFFSETFDGLNAGSLHNQNSWIVSPTNAVTVQSSVQRGGSGQAGRMTNATPAATSLARRSLAVGAPTNVVWTDCYVQPVPGRADFDVATNASAVVGVQTNSGCVVVYNGTNAVVLTGRPGVTPGAWTRFTIGADYRRRTWSLWVNATNMANNLRFYNTNLAQFASFGLQEGSTNGSVSYLDDLTVTDSLPVDVTDPGSALSIANASVTEGDSGTTSLTFSVTLSMASAVDVSFGYATSDGNATQGADYQATNVTAVTLPAGAMSTTIVVMVLGDTIDEANETFLVTLTNVTGAAQGTVQATGTILDDDPDMTIRADGGAESLTPTQATANVAVDVPGAPGTVTWVFWGDNDGTTNTSGINGWDCGRILGTNNTGAMTGLLTNLTTNTTLFYRGCLSNASKVAWSETRPFATGPWTLDFAETFDAMSAGNIQGQRGWVAVTNYSALVQDAVVRGGLAVGITNRSTGRTGRLAHTFEDNSATNQVWTDLYVQPVFNGTPDFTPPANATAVFCVQTNSGFVMVCDGTNTLILTDRPAVAPAAWTRFTIAADYSNKTWSLWMNTTNLISGLGFFNATKTRFASVNAEEGSTNGGVCYLDDVRVTATRPADVLDDGLTLSIADAAAVEGHSGTTSVVFTVSLSGPSARDVFFDYATVGGGTAAVGSDYATTNVTGVTIVAGTTNKTVAVSLMGDTFDEPNETFFVSLSNIRRARAGNALAVGTILDDDADLAGDVPGGAINVTSNSATINVSVTCTGGAPTQAWLYWGTVDGATNKPGTVAGHDWSYSVYFGTNGVGTFASSLASLAPQTTYYFRTYLSNTYNQAWSPTRQFTTGPWVLPFVETFETLSLGDLQGQHGWGVLPDAAGYVQGLIARGSQAAGVTNRASGGTGRLTHVFDDSAATNQVWTDCYVQPVFNGTADITPAANATVVFYARTNTGHLVVYDGTNALVLTTKPAVTPGAWTRFTIQADYASKTWSLWMNTTNMAVGLGFFNATKTRFASFNAEEGATNGVLHVDDVRATVTRPVDILDDGPSLSIADAGFTEGNSGTTSVVFTVSLSQPSAMDVSFDYATTGGTAVAGTDYLATNVTGVIIAAGATSRTVTVSVVGDAFDEPNETFFVTLRNVRRAQVGDTLAVGTILDDEADLAGNALGGAVNVTSNSATVNVSVTCTGGAPTQAWLYWGAVDGTTNKPGTAAGRDWQYTVSFGTTGVSTFTSALATLTPQTTYYFRTYLSNTYNQAWSDTRQFTTGPWRLPFAETFETLSPGNMQGQRGWTVDPNFAGYAQSLVAHGSQAGGVTNNTTNLFGRLTHAFDDPSATNVVWTDCYVQPVFNGAANFTPPANATALFYVQTNSGFVVVYSGTNAVVLSNKAAVVVGTLNRFTIKANYATRRWDLYVKEALVAQDLGFYNTNITRFARFGIDEGATNATCAVDDVAISFQMPVLQGGVVFKFK